MKFLASPAMIMLFLFISFVTLCLFSARGLCLIIASLSLITTSCLGEWCCLPLPPHQPQWPWQNNRAGDSDKSNKVLSGRKWKRRKVLRKTMCLLSFCIGNSFIIREQIIWRVQIKDILKWISQAVWFVFPWMHKKNHDLWLQKYYEIPYQHNQTLIDSRWIEHKVNVI